MNDTASRPSPDGDATALLVHLRARISRVAHDINNPLAIISGNAQLLVELARLGGMEPDVEKAVLDIEEASRRLAERVQELAALKEEVAALVGEAAPGTF